MFGFASQRADAGAVSRSRMAFYGTQIYKHHGILLGMIMDEIKKKLNIVQTKKIDKGMSGDTKFALSDAAGRRYLLRIADIGEFEAKKREFDLMTRWNGKEIPMPKALHFGVCDNGTRVFTLLEWVDGDEVDRVLPSLDAEKKYSLGAECGRILKKIHTLGSELAENRWYEDYFSVIDDRLRYFFKENEHFEGDTAILGFLHDNRALLKNRPLCYHHGDYHTGNMILTPDAKLKIIDWHTVDFNNYGDPWYEFNRIAFEYPEFATGQIDGYFDNEPPNDFWTLLSYYLAASAITSVVWAKYWAPEEYGRVMKLNKDILNDFDYFRRPKPRWYLRGQL